jgi:hypothetical protein
MLCVCVCLVCVGGWRVVARRGPLGLVTATPPTPLLTRRRGEGAGVRNTRGRQPWRRWGAGVGVRVRDGGKPLSRLSLLALCPPLTHAEKP